MSTDLAGRNKIRVLIVDDSAIVRRVLTDTLSVEPDLEVVGTAPDASVAREKILRLQPDVLTLDIEMPGLDGLSFLKELMGIEPLPVVVISSLAQSSSRAALEAMEYGAVEVMAKPGGPYSVGELKTQLPDKIRAAAIARLKRAAHAVEPAQSRQMREAKTDPPALDPAAVIAIGASTGGTEALRQILTAIPKQSPPILIVQHIPAVFSRTFAERLDSCCQIRVREAGDGEEALPGTALIAPGNLHMSIHLNRGRYQVVLTGGEPVCYQRPSVDVLFESVARHAGKHATGAILTGMGSDGARGLCRMKQAGAHTIAQDEESCVVFGMPKEAIRLGCVDQVLTLNQIAHALIADRASSEFHPASAQAGRR